MRKLARIEEIINIQPIENVDAIELANVKGMKNFKLPNSIGTK